ncbi:protease modulator HflC [Candidatus Moduliflexota bacterium]
MKNVLGIIIVVALFVAALTLTGALFVVNEVQQVILTQFGRPVGDPIVEPGIHFKIPYMQTANYFDKRYLEWDGAANQIPTKDKKFIWVDSYARWRIIDPLLFFQRLRDESGAQSRLDDILDGETRNSIANHALVEIVRSSNREFERSDDLGETEESDILQEIIFGRDQITREILASAAPQLASLGIELVDLRFKRINYVEAVRKKVYERMVSERNRIASKYRSEGQGESASIRGQKERELKGITSEAYRQAQEIIGKADAEATRIYAEAYNQDPEFYEFIKTLETYGDTFDEETWLILTTDGEFFQYLKGVK